MAGKEPARSGLGTPPDHARMRSGQRAPLALPSLGPEFPRLKKVPGMSAVLGFLWPPKSSSPKALGSVHTLARGQAS